MLDSDDFHLTASVGSQYGGSRPHDVVRTPSFRTIPFAGLTG